ncbi:MAG: cytochrome P460 family protein [Rhodocyclaceae bacterium]|nr:cytochrome P460 family protein [Rhodocyclaceae bacterium]
MNKYSAFCAAVAGATLAACAGTAMQSTESEKPPFGDAASMAFAADLWQAMGAAGLRGSDALHGTPYTGQHPHGAILDTLDTTLTVAGRQGEIIVKRNYGGEGVSKAAVADDPGRYLKAVTVMFRREKGYDPDNADWFWVKYLPDGSLDRNAKGMALAGRVAKGASQGCIACHRGAPGGDMVFNNDRY